MAKAKKAGKLHVTLVRSPIGEKPRHRRTVKALGLHRMHQTVEHEASDSIMGMVRSVSHLVKLEEGG
jgi:large subunit ribosomal protein L30